MIPFALSDLPHTWFFDLDGTILKHNGHLSEAEALLPGVKELWKKIPDGDTIIITTGRAEIYKTSTIKFLNENEIRFNMIIFNLPYGERILINDIKDSGLVCAYAWNVERDKGFL